MTNAAAVATSVRTRTQSWLVSAGFSVQVNWVHAHQMSQPTRIEWSTPVGVRSGAVPAVIWVTAKTNTRSKNSSTKVTPCGPAARTLRRTSAPGLASGLVSA